MALPRHPGHNEEPPERHDTPAEPAASRRTKVIITVIVVVIVVAFLAMHLASRLRAQ